MTRVLLLTVDSLRADRLTPERFPECWPFFRREFDRFASAYSHGVATPFAFPGIVCGVPPEGDGTLPDTPTLAEWAAGRSVGFANNPHLRPDRGYDRGFDRYSFAGGRAGESVAGRLKARLSRSSIVQRVYGRVTDFLSDTDDGSSEPYRLAEEQVDRTTAAVDEGASFCWTHFQDPHFPFSLGSVPDRDLADRFDPDRVEELNHRYFDGALAADSDGMETLRAVYDESVKYLDRQLARLFETLDDRGWFDDGVVAVTADHGETFGEEGLVNHPWDARPVDELVRVPLLVADSARRTGEHDELVGHGQLHRTLATRLDESAADERADLFGGGGGTERVVVSKSNAVVRCIGTRGEVTRFRDGRVETEGSPGETVERRAREASFPAIEKLAGELPGVSETDRDAVEEQLQALGYTE